jgi:hypothetical protein
MFNVYKYLNMILILYAINLFLYWSHFSKKIKKCNCRIEGFTVWLSVFVESD